MISSMLDTWVLSCTIWSNSTLGLVESAMDVSDQFPSLWDTSIVVLVKAIQDDLLRAKEKWWKTSSGSLQGRLNDTCTGIVFVFNSY
ncbi:hypothetical protein ACH5RR_030892 [Cinchona calisaya]|uniref:Uncharacterized protein n=1 Tax=Cinchona calisaya TaxID=153742 RepID=A0ABD2YVZ7_9GENT